MIDSSNFELDEVFFIELEPELFQNDIGCNKKEFKDATTEELIHLKRITISYLESRKKNKNKYYLKFLSRVVDELKIRKSIEKPKIKKEEEVKNYF